MKKTIDAGHKWLSAMERYVNVKMTVPPERPPELDSRMLKKLKTRDMNKILSVNEAREEYEAAGKKLLKAVDRAIGSKTDDFGT